MTLRETTKGLFQWFLLDHRLPCRFQRHADIILGGSEFTKWCVILLWNVYGFEELPKEWNFRYWVGFLVDFGQGCNSLNWVRIDSLVSPVDQTGNMRNSWSSDAWEKGQCLALVPWRWSSWGDLAPALLPQVCDDEWHHYALNLEFPTVTLYADGISFDPALIHDNGLIHPPRREPALMIGACWTGKSLSFSVKTLKVGASSGLELGQEQGQSVWLHASPCCWAGWLRKLSSGDHLSPTYPTDCRLWLGGISISAITRLVL